jgi:non-specific serine/threonine protein kinase
MLQTIREFALECLAAMGHEQDVRRQHLACYLALAEEAEGELTGPQQSTWLERLEQEHDNLRAALRWARETGEVEAGLRLGGALWRFWWVRGHLTEGRRWLDELLEAAGSAEHGAQVHKGARAKALQGDGVLAYAQGDHERTAALNHDALALWRELGDKQGIAFVLNNMGVAEHEHGNYEAASALHEESLALRRELGDRRGISVSLANLGVVARYRGDNKRAIDLYEGSLLLRRELGDKRGIAVALNNLGEIALRQGDHERTAGLLGESLLLFQALGDKVYVATCLEGLALVAGAQGQAARATRVLAAAGALRRAIGVPLLAADRAGQDAVVHTARNALGEERFGATWAEGETMELEQAVAYALQGAVVNGPEGVTACHLAFGEHSQASRPTS